MPGPLLPVFLKLEGRSCLVIGAGEVAAAKIASLLDSRARVTVVAPRACPWVERAAADQKLRWIRRSYERGDARGMFLAIAAASDPDANRSLFEETRREGILCNSVDDPPHCDFYFPAVVRRGDLPVAVSTAGQSPAFAQRLRRELDQALEPSLGPRLRRIGASRRRILKRLPPSGERRRLLRQLAYADAAPDAGD